MSVLNYAGNTSVVREKGARRGRARGLWVGGGAVTFWVGGGGGFRRGRGQVGVEGGLSGGGGGARWGGMREGWKAMRFDMRNMWHLLCKAIQRGGAERGGGASFHHSNRSNHSSHVPGHSLERPRDLERARQWEERQEREEHERNLPRAQTLGKASFTSRLRPHTLAASGLRAHVNEGPRPCKKVQTNSLTSPQTRQLVHKLADLTSVMTILLTILAASTQKPVVNFTTPFYDTNK